MSDQDHDYAEQMALHYAAAAVDVRRMLGSSAEPNTTTLRFELDEALTRCAQWEAVARVLRRR